MQVQIVDELKTVPCAQWNTLTGKRFPFLRHEFLSALERHQCVGAAFGWLPRHITVRDERGRLIGAMPMYLKDNSYGEFVFDWSWADAYERAGLAYYPKAVVAAPYTPATGPRLLVQESAQAESTRQVLHRTALDFAQAEQLSSIHFLFTTEEDTEFLSGQGNLLRLGCQFHWENRNYESFDAFLDTLSSRKRKKIRRERRRVREEGIRIEVVNGHDATDVQWNAACHFYRTTFEKKWGAPTLNAGFFREIAGTMGDDIVLVFASHNGEIVAGAINLKGADTLYGRHWGCKARFHSLHFEVCYYQGIEYCIRKGLKLFEPGAQGEHKLSRGFLPTPTWSAHWIADRQFRSIIGNFLDRETRAMRDYMATLNEHSPFRAPDSHTAGID